MLLHLTLGLLGALASGPPYTVPTAKRVIRQMDDVISNHVAVYDWPAWSAIMEPFWTTDLIYDSVHGVGNFTGLREWFDGEHVAFNRGFDEVVFNQLLFLGEDTSASTTTYALARWYGEFAGMQPTGDVVRLRICDFYRMRGERISYNWMMLDLPDLLRQAGRRVLPQAPRLRDDGWFQPPSAMDGVPAPNSRLTTPAAAEASRDVARAILDHDWFERAGGAPSIASPLWAKSMRFYGPSGIGFADSRHAYEEDVLGAVRGGLSERSFELDVLTCEGAYCGAHGHLRALHTGCFLGERPTGRPVRLRIALHWHVVGGVATEGYAMFDAPALFGQLGIDLLARTSAPPSCTPPLGATAPGVATVVTAPAAAAAPMVTAAVPATPSGMWSNECLLSGGEALQPPTAGAPTTFLNECAAWVVRTTDAVWSPDADAASVNASLEAYFYEGWSSISSFGKVYTGMSALKELVWKTKTAFPDLRIHITDVFCTVRCRDATRCAPDTPSCTHDEPEEPPIRPHAPMTCLTGPSPAIDADQGNDIDGYKTTMPDVLTGTNLGPSGFGPPTGRKVAYNGIAVCYVQRVGGRWQYVSEVVVHDELSLMGQLGVVPPAPMASPSLGEGASPHDCTTIHPSWGWQPPATLAAAATTAAAAMATTTPTPAGSPLTLATAPTAASSPQTPPAIKSSVITPLGAGLLGLVGGSALVISRLTRGQPDGGLRYADDEVRYVAAADADAVAAAM